MAFVVLFLSFPLVNVQQPKKKTKAKAKAKKGLTTTVDDEFHFASFPFFFKGGEGGPFLPSIFFYS